jgi:CubicO group peptidase (beta-lactamase class C family)
MTDQPAGSTSTDPPNERGAPGAPQNAQPLDEDRVIRLSADDQRRFAEALINPPAPNEALKRAAQHYRLLVGPTATGASLLEAQLLEGRHSTDSALTTEDWDDIRREALTQLDAKK